MTQPIKKDVWDLDVEVSETHRVCFGRELTLREAKMAYIRGDFDDVIDERDTSVVRVIGES